MTTQSGEDNGTRNFPDAYGFNRLNVIFNNDSNTFGELAEKVYSLLNPHS